ncbi:MAG: hypothetical protein AAGJ32_01625 [Pseudomonadota bacterium]
MFKRVAAIMTTAAAASPAAWAHHEGMASSIQWFAAGAAFTAVCAIAAAAWLDRGRRSRSK